MSTRGFWSAEERVWHINHLELLALYLALLSFAHSLSNSEILLRVDNTIAISYITRFGGTKIDHLNNLARKIWQWCERRHLWLFASYIPSRENTDADQKSRSVNIDTEWELADYAFKQITNNFGYPDIDMFASRINAKCKDYCFCHKDPFASTVDAFTIEWKNLYFYAFSIFLWFFPLFGKS